MQLSHNLKFASAQGKYGNLNIGNILGPIHVKLPIGYSSNFNLKLANVV